MPQSPSSVISAIETRIAQDPRGRGIANLVQPGALERAARLLAHPGRVMICSGFYLPVPQAGETDGPPGAKAIGDALAALGGEPVYVTDELNAPLFEAMGLRDVRRYAPGLLDTERPDVLLATERPGRARDGRYYSMSGRDVTDCTAPIDELFLEAPARGLPTVAIGDGGNEIGMGNVLEEVMRDVPHGETIATVVRADHLIVAGVSNFGAYGLVAAISLVAGRALLPTPAAGRADVEACVAAGGCCGHTFVNGPFVDGLPLEDTEAMLRELHAFLDRPGQAVAQGD